MKDRARQEKRDGELFYVDDYVYEPPKFRPEMIIYAFCCWRASETDD
ncbi:MAG: hypothetical protein AAGF94_18905 [Pseudomonadota bacterium]